MLYSGKVDDRDSDSDPCARPGTSESDRDCRFPSPRRAASTSNVTSRRRNRPGPLRSDPGVTVLFTHGPRRLGPAAQPLPRRDSGARRGPGAAAAVTAASAGDRARRRPHASRTPGPPAAVRESGDAAAVPGAWPAVTRPGGDQAAPLACGESSPLQVPHGPPSDGIADPPLQPRGWRIGDSPILSLPIRFYLSPSDGIADPLLLPFALPTPCGGQKDSDSKGLASRAAR